MSRVITPCKFCELDPLTGRGRDFYREKYLSDEYMYGLDGGDEELTYIEVDKLVVNIPDNQLYSRDITEIPIKYCPMCGREL